MDITFQALDRVNEELKKTLVEFIYKNLGEFKDEKDSIAESFLYLEQSACGGKVFQAVVDQSLVGCAVVLQTGMKKFIPENILVYLVVDSHYRGRKIGSQLLDYVLNNLEGDVALHVEPHNPAKSLYESFGFNNKYLEMRLIKNY